MANPALDATGSELSQAAGVLWLLWLRMAPMTILVPVLSLPSRPMVASAALSIAVTISLWPIAMLSSPTLPDGALAMFPLALREGLIGTVLALALAGPLLAIGWAGTLADRLLDADAAQAPALPTAGPDGPMATLYLWCGLLLLFSMGGHRLVIETMGAHVIGTPVGVAGQLVSLQPALLASARVLADALSLSLSLAGPVLIAALVLELATGLIGRLSSGPGLGPAALSLRRLSLIAVVMLGAPMLMGRLPDLFRAALEQATAIL